MNETKPILPQPCDLCDSLRDAEARVESYDNCYSDCGTCRICLTARVAELEADRKADIGYEMAGYLAAEIARITDREAEDWLDEARSAIRAALDATPGPPSTAGTETESDWRCEGCNCELYETSDHDTNAAITDDDVWLCLSCYDEVPRTDGGTTGEGGGGAE